MNRSQAEEYLRSNHRCVLSTIKRNGRPQLSNVLYLYDDDGRIKISVTQDRAKTKNVLRDPWVALLVLGDNFFEYLVVEGEAEILSEDVLPKLRHIYERIAGKPHPNWSEFDEAMIRENRVVMSITPVRMYPLE